MRKENSYDFRKKLLTVHQPGLRDLSIRPKDDEFWFEDGAKIKISVNACDVIKTASTDFVDFLRVSMGIFATVVTDGISEINTSVAQTAEEKNILGDMASYKGFMYTVDASGVNILANDERGVQQALYYIEDMMCFSKTPALPFGTVRKKPLYSPLMNHSGYGLDEYPDEYLNRIAHEGRDAILVFTTDVNKTPMGYLDFNDLISRAARYGIDVYAYSYLISEMSPEAPEAEQYYDNLYGRLFRECPGLKGVTLVGESVEFPSRDTHVSPGWKNQTAIDGIPTGKKTAGWYPCEDYPLWLNLVKNSVRKYNPDADIVFWTYNWGYQPEDARVRLIESLPTDISLQATFEMFEPIHYDNTMGRCEDYTLSFSGPGVYFESEAKAAKKRGIRLYSMTNTGGLTWDFGMVPYEPMPYQWIKRYMAMEQAHKEWGLCGLMESHHYGFYPSFISKLSKHVFLEPHETAEVILKKIIKSEFGEACYEDADAALRCLSDAICCYTPSASDQYGAFRVGPSYPFNLSEALSLPPDEKSKNGVRYCKMRYINISDERMSPLSLRIHDEIASLKKMICFIDEGIKYLKKVKNPNQALLDLLNLSKFIRNYTQTGLHAKMWHVLICKMNVETDKDKLLDIYNDMEILLKAELKNAEDTIPLVEYDSRLGWEPTMLYLTDRRHLEWKIRQVRYVLESDLPKYKHGLLQWHS